MEGLDEFEKSLAADRAEREREGRQVAEAKEKKHRHRHRHHHDKHGRPSEKGESSKERDSHRRRRSRDREPDREGHRHKRSRHSGEDQREHPYKELDESRRSGDDSDDPKYLKAHDAKRDLPLPDAEIPMSEQGLVRDSWMTAPSAIEVDYIHRGKKEKKAPSTQDAQRYISERELNSEVLQSLNQGTKMDDVDIPKQRKVNYKFGDEGSQWRMTKLKAVYTTAEQTHRLVDDVAVERFGSLQEFDDAREEKIEIDRGHVYGQGYIGKETPTGDLYRDRIGDIASNPAGDASDDLKQGTIIPEPQTSAPLLDQTALNRLRAQMMKAKLRNAADAEKLEVEYNAAMAVSISGAKAGGSVVLDASHNRMLAGSRGEVKSVDTKRGRERGLVEANEDMSIDDMVREERRTRGAAGGEGRRLAERIAKDVKFDDDLEYLDENAEKLAKRVHQSGASLKNVAVNEFTRMNKILDSCPLCHHEDRNPPQDLPLAPILSLATRVFLTLPTEPELTGAEGGAVVVPINHRANLLECDDDEWEEIRNFMKSLTRLYHDQGREIIFYENAAAPHRRLHAALVVVPIPYDLGDTAPAFFREAMLSADEEWSQHKKIIDTGKRARDGLGKLAFRRSITKEMPYFHAWFNLDGGLGHVVEDSGRWPKGDLFAREIIGGMLDTEPDVIKRQGRWSRSDPRAEPFKKRWRKFDWTRVLTEGQEP